MQEELTATFSSCIMSLMTMIERGTDVAPKPAPAAPSEQLQAVPTGLKGVILRPIAKVVESWFLRLEELENVKPPATPEEPTLDELPHRKG